jgi:phage terminase large subunit-like protein
MKIFNRDELPLHLLKISELNIVEHCLTDRLSQPWFCLGETFEKKNKRCEEYLNRETLLLKAKGFEKYIDKFNCIGAQLRNLGHPTVWTSSDKGRVGYRYVPFHSFEIAFGEFKGEPLVFRRALNGDFVINPDLWLFLALNEKREPEHVWYDDEKHCDVIRMADDGKAKHILIRTDYLKKYLQARRLQLVVSEYRQAIVRPGDDDRFKDFVCGTEVISSNKKNAKVVVESYGPKNDLGAPYYIRRMQLWSAIAPKPIDKDDPFAEKPSFDPASFLLPTRKGLVAPARHLGSMALKYNFKGVHSDFMDRVYFSQEVLVKYQNLPGYEISDEGAIRHKYYWSFDRGVSRFGDDYLAIAIGDFAEGVTFDDWAHWKQFAQEPPDDVYFERVKKSKDRINQVNLLTSELYGLNEMVEYFCLMVAPELAERPLWKGFANEQAVRELKWYIANHANDAEFRKRATLLSTLIVDDLDVDLMRTLLLDLDVVLVNESKLGSIKLLQRLTLVAKLIAKFRTHENLKDLVLLAKTGVSLPGNEEVVSEIAKVNQDIFELFTPLVALYDLRLSVGYAHPPSADKVAAAIKLLGLPASGWGRAEYLTLLSKLSTAISRIGEIIQEGAQVVSSARMHR